MERDEIDFGTLKVSVLFRKLFIPTLFGMLSISAVTVADGIFVGHGVGSDGIAAVNIYVPLLMLFQGVGLMIGIGCSVVASIHLSRAKVKAARLNVTQAMIIVTALTLLLSLLIVVFPDRTACLLGSSDRLLPLVKDYLLWFTPALVFQMWTAVGLFVIRLDGAPKLAMWCSVVAALLNVVLDWLFIFPLGWGVMGAAFATAISVSVGGVIVVVYLSFFARTLRFCPLKRSRKSLRLSLRNVGYQCRIGSSALLGEATLAMLMFVGNLTFMHYLGDDGVGAFGIACYYIPFVFMVGNAIAQSAQPIISYNFGAGVRERVIEAAQIALATAVVCGAAVTAVFIGSPRLLVGLFLDPATHAARIAIEGLPWFALGFICFIVNLTAIGYYQSLERVGIASGFALLRGFVFLVPSFLFMPRLCGTEGIWLAMPLSELLTALVILGVSFWRRQLLAASADRLIGSVRLRTKRDAADGSIPFRSFRRHQTVMISRSLRSSAASSVLENFSNSFCTCVSPSFDSSSGIPSFCAFLKASTASRRALRRLTRAVSASCRICFTSSLRRSSVSGGIDRRICSPLFEGVRPILESMIAFSIGLIIFLSHGWIRIVFASGTVTLATPDTGVIEP